MGGLIEGLDGQKLLDSLQGGEIGATHHYGADQFSNELASWQPQLVSGDEALLGEQDVLRARAEDSVRNHGLLHGATQTHLDNVVGGDLKLMVKPDYMALGLDDQWAKEWARDVLAKWRCFANDIDNHIDARKMHNFSGLVSQAYRSYLVSFEVAAIEKWRPNRGGCYATCVAMMDPARIQTPDHKTDSDSLRGGVQMDRDGAATSYWFASNLAGDSFRYGSEKRFKRVSKYYPWGRQKVIHLFDADKSGQTRGRNGMVSILSKTRMLDKFESSTLQAAILNAMYAAVIESDYDWKSVMQALDGPVGGDDDDPANHYMKQRAKFHANGKIRHDGVKIPHLYAGEKLKFTTPTHPMPNFGQYQEATLRHLAGGLNLSYEQLSRDYSKSNYSSARAAMLESWRFFSNKRHNIAGRFGRWVYALWLEEAVDRGEVELPPGAPGFYEAKTAYTGCEWLGPGRGQIDPMKEKAASKIDMDMGLTNMQIEGGDRGRDWESTLEQRAYEIKRAKEIAEDHGIDYLELFPESPAAVAAATVQQVEINE